MKTRTLLLGAVASFALAGAASAHGGWYVGIEGGGNWIEDADAVGTLGGLPTSGTVPTDSGWILLGTVGHEFSKDWRLEGELGYRENATDSGGYIEITQLSFMVNVLYDMSISPSSSVSVGAGIGYNETTFDFGGLAEASDSDFAWQGILGLNWALGEQTDLTIRYRYFNVGGPSLSAGAGIASIDFDDVTEHTVTVGVLFRMGPPSQ